MRWKGMRWKVLLAACAIAVVVVLPAAALPSTKTTRISVSPASGRGSSTFTLHFTAPHRTGRFGSMDRRDEVSLSGPAGRKGCVAAASSELAPTRAGVHVRAKLIPLRLGGHWCTGTFRGAIQEIGRPVCQPGRACPEFVVLISRVGTFGFTVRRQAP